MDLNSSGNAKIKIMVVDDQRLVRRCIIARLNAYVGFEVVAEAQSGEAAREIARKQDVDVVLMDLNMPGIGGLEATRRFLTSEPATKIIGLSMYIDGPYPRRFLELGGVGYVSKSADSEELINAIEQVHSGKRYITNDVAQRIALADAEQQRGIAINQLSAREIQVLQKVSGGFGIDEIASMLCLSPKTVAHHRRSLYRKLNVHNDVQLATIARAHGLDAIGELEEA